MPPAATQPKQTGGKRSAARLAAVQAVYQIDSTGEKAALVINEFISWRMGQEVDGDLYAPADEEFFRDLVEGVSEGRDALVEKVSAALTGKRPFEQLERLVQAILLVGAYELTSRPDIPTPVAINEYVDLAHAFFEGPEPSFINGVLDRIAKESRQA